MTVEAWRGSKSALATPTPQLTIHSLHGARLRAEAELANDVEGLRLVLRGPKWGRSIGSLTTQLSHSGGLLDVRSC